MAGLYPSINDREFDLLKKITDNLATLVDSGGGGSLPSQIGHAGEYLTTDGSSASWAMVAGTGTVTSVSVVTANGVSATVATSTTTPALTFTLGAITPSSIAVSGLSTFTGAIIGVYAAMGALAVDVSKWGNTYSATGDVIFTYSNATPTAGTTTRVRITADGTDRTITIPTTWSIARGGNITSLLVPANTVLQVVLQYVSSRWEIIGDPVQTNGTGKYLLAAGTIAITSGKTVTFDHTSTFTTTDSQTYTFPTTSATLARTDAAQTFTGVQTITNITLPTNGQILLTVPTTDGHATGPTTNAYNSGYSSSAVGDLVYLDSSNTWQKCDANTLALYNGLLGIALEVKASGAALLVALPGSFVYATGFPTFTVGSPIYMSETAGAVTQTAPTTADSATRIVGWGIHADKMYFFPSPDYTTHV